MTPTTRSVLPSIAPGIVTVQRAVFFSVVLFDERFSLKSPAASVEHGMYSRP